MTPLGETELCWMRSFLVPCRLDSVEGENPQNPKFVLLRQDRNNPIQAIIGKQE